MEICKIKNSNYEKTMKAFDKILKDYPYSKVGFDVDYYKKSMDSYNTVVIRLEGNEIHCGWSEYAFLNSKAPTYEAFVMASRLDIE